MLPNRPQDAFVYNPKTDQIDPLNLIATDKVKCLNCNKFYLCTEIEAHLQTHINQQLTQRSVTPPVIVPQNKSQTVRPLDLNKLAHKNPLRTSLYSQSTFDIPSEPIDVQTMTADELPRPEFRRKEIDMPLPQTVIHNSQDREYRTHQGFGENIDVQPSNILVNTNIPIDSMREQLAMGDYFEEIKIAQPRSISIVGNNGMALKRNINTATVVERDDYIDHAKVPDSVRDTNPRKNTYSVVAYDPRREDDKNASNMPSISISKPKPSSSLNPGIVEVPNDRRYLGVDSYSRLTTTKKEIRNSGSIDIAPVSQSIGGIDLSRATNKFPHRSQQQPQPQQQSRSRGNFFSLFCGDPQNTLDNQFDTNPNLAISQYQFDHSHSHNDGGNYACPSCGGFYCPTCHSTVPPEYRRPPPYVFGQDIRC